ncbi:mastermind-like protein 3 [Microcaecilia unicolor]|uniref:Mastermind-like protein 3 n=1 Tax=Microcaecilia unicolor TaxID=1415580 RepID=A0A6P7XBQ4_9AMPH|nr:mastermind-like protein 3 [Microcaecilia unicolor]
MGDFGVPVASAGSNLCISANLAGSLVLPTATSNRTPPPPLPSHGAPAGATSGGGCTPKHSTVVERLRQRIEGCRKHHVHCESRYQQAQAEQLELERRDTASLYQRSLEHRTKKVGAGGGNKQQQHPLQGKQQQPDAEPAAAEQRNHTLIMLQETVKRKLEGARSPINGEQQNGVCDGSFSPTSKRMRKDVPGVDTVNNLSSNMPLPSVSPLHQLDIKPSLPVQNNGNHPSRLDDLGKNGGLPEIKLPINGCTELEESFGILQNKELKHEPLDDPTGIDTSETSLSNQNKLFSDINLNDQEWQELIDELANTVPEDDIQDLFNEDFEEKKELEFPRPTAHTPLPRESASVKSDPSHSPFPHVPIGSPQARPSSSGPPFSNISTTSSVPSVSSAPVLAGSPTSCIVHSPPTPNQAHTPGQTQSRHGNGYLINSAAVAGSGPGSLNITSADLSPAEQLKQMAAQQQQRAKLMQQKQQQPPPHSGQTSSWSPVGPPSSPYGGPFPTDKPNSPMMYPQAFNNQNAIVPQMASGPPKSTMNNYHMNMVNQQPNNLGMNAINKQPGMLSYGNTKPLTHFSAELNQRMTPPMANPSKNPMMPYLPPQQTQMTHLSEEQKCLLLMKQKGLMTPSMGYTVLPAHGQDQNQAVMSRPSGPMQPSVPVSGNMVQGADPGTPGYLANQPQAAIMKQMLIEQRAQLQAMEQQKQQFLREHRQQQQILAEQQMQQQQQQPHLPRHHLPQQRNPYTVPQVNQFQGSPQDIAMARNQVALQNMRSSRMMVQNAGMMPMGPSQNPGTMPTTTAQPELGMAPYSNASASQPGMYSMSTGMNQMLQHPSQSNMSIAHNSSQGPRQPASALGAGMVRGFSQSILVNSAMAQQHHQMKGPAVGQAMSRSQAPRLQTVMGATVSQGTQNWQQQSLQGMPGRTNAEIVPYSNGPVYPMQPGQPRMAKQHFSQGLNQTILDGTGTVRALNPSMGRQMIQPLPGQQGTNQARSLVPGMNQGVPNLTGFNQTTNQHIPDGNFGQSNHGQSYDRNPSQDMSYSYSEGAGGSFPGIGESPNLVDSIIKGGAADEWIQELDELFGNP